jgi:hypothetical protein
LKKIFKVVSIFFLLNIFVENVYTQCNDLGAFLNNGWNIDPDTLHDVDYGGNWDEFAVADPSPFMLKVGLYPPVKVFKHEITNCRTMYYFAFDSDNENTPNLKT